MKTKHLVITILACIFALAMSSCNSITDAQISAFEKSIDKLEKNYKDFTPSQLEKAVSLCQDQLERLEDKELTINQKERLRSLKFKYYKLLVKIRLHSTISDTFKSNDGQSVIEYLNGLVDSAAANAKELLGE